MIGRKRIRAMSYTNRARLALALTPLWLPLVLVANVPYAIYKAGDAFWWHADFVGTLREWYRLIYRPAIYGSVHDPLARSQNPT